MDLGGLSKHHSFPSAPSLCSCGKAFRKSTTKNKEAEASTTKNENKEAEAKGYCVGFWLWMKMQRDFRLKYPVADHRYTVHGPSKQRRMFNAQHRDPNISTSQATTRTDLEGREPSKSPGLFQII